MRTFLRKLVTWLFLAGVLLLMLPFALVAMLGAALERLGDRPKQAR